MNRKQWSWIYLSIIDTLEEEKKHFLTFMGIAAYYLKAPVVAFPGFLWLILNGYTGKINEKQNYMLGENSQGLHF